MCMPFKKLPFGDGQSNRDTAYSGPIIYPVVFDGP